MLFQNSCSRLNCSIFKKVPYKFYEEVDLFCSEKILFKMDKEIPKDLTFPKLRFKNVKEVKKLDEYGPPPDNDCFFLRYPHQLGAKYCFFSSFRSLKHTSLKKYTN